MWEDGTGGDGPPSTAEDDVDPGARAGAARAILFPLLTIAGMVLLWELVVRAFGIRPYLLPAPSAVFQELIVKFGTLVSHGRATLFEVVVGYVASVLLALPLAIMMVQWRWFEAAVYPILVISQTVPKMAIAPLFVVWLGFGLTPKILVVFLIAFFPIVIDGVVGLRAIHPDMIKLARSMGASPYQVFRMFRFPNALPNIFAGLKVSMTLAVVGAIVGEFIGGDRGLGYLLQVTAFNFQTPLLFATIVVLLVLGLLLFLAIVVLESLVVPWETERIRRQDNSATL